MKTTIIAFSAAALIAAAPAVPARTGSGKTPDQHHQVAGKHARQISGDARWHAMHGNGLRTGLRTGYPNAFGYAPSEPRDSALESSRQAGGGGGGGSGM